jgi:hypothetical protein
MLRDVPFSMIYFTSYGPPRSPLLSLPPEVTLTFVLGRSFEPSSSSGSSSVPSLVQFLPDQSLTF